jgi:hypothetical protein
MPMNLKLQCIYPHFVYWLPTKTFPGFLSVAHRSPQMCTCRCSSWHGSWLTQMKSCMNSRTCQGIRHQASNENQIRGLKEIEWVILSITLCLNAIAIYFRSWHDGQMRDMWFGISWVLNCLSQCLGSRKKMGCSRQTCLLPL